MSLIREVTVGDKLIKLEFQRFAKQANGSVMVSCGDTQVLVTVCAADEVKEGQDFFPLTVDYIEKFYAAGRIPGGYIKRETKPSEREALISRVIDRPLRPSFPEEYMCDTQIVATVMSFDPQHNPAPLALLGASAALMVSDIPFNGPVASLRIGLHDGKLILDPLNNQPSDLDLNVACRPDAILMVEAGANFLSEEQMLSAITTAQQWMKPLFDVQLEAQRLIGKPKRTVVKKAVDEALKAKVYAAAKGPIAAGFAVSDKQERNKALKAAGKQVIEAVVGEGDGPEVKGAVKGILEELKYNMMRSQILDEKRRIGGRGFRDVRDILCETRVLRRPHGSSLFQRGETQAVATVTLGAGDDEQRLDSIHAADEFKSFMLHYNFPPFSVGEAKPLRGLSRREMGHGALAERALAQIIPTKNKFGYTVRLVSEVLESNGSSSMATVCAGTMALLDAGVPIVEPVAGIAMGLIKEGDKYAILTDILGDEDHLGDMDFKVCGGENGITALQMDIKIGGLSNEIMSAALEQAKEGRRHILGKMRACIAQPKELSEYAPRIFHLKIPTDRIRDLIGPGGKMVKKIVADTGVKIDISDDGMVNIVSPDVVSAEAAKSMIRTVTTDPEIGGIYLGNVKRIVDFGAFIEIRPGQEGLCHISELEEGRVNKVTDVLKEGEEVMVKVLDIDRQGKIKLSRRGAFGKKPTP
ncbi:MAG: polyribonucleotide nucleotidyltransferase [Deltaproteobacteria bacterium]|nr:polyribonucleotide nucleotidyltransferase [Deltaproteobacteria bacterium]